MAVLSALVDDFTGTTLDLAKWSDTSAGTGSVAVAGGRLRLAPALTAPSGASITSATNYTWTGSFTYARLLPPAVAGVRTSMIVTDAASPGSVEVYILDGQVGLRTVSTTGTVTTAAQILGTYEAAAFNYLRIDFTGSTYLVQRSPDTVTWTNVASATTWTTGWSANVVLRLASASSNTQTAAFESQVDSVSVRSPQDNKAASGPRMALTRTNAAQRTTVRTGLNARTLTTRIKTATVSPTTGGSAAVVAGARAQLTRPTVAGQTVGGGTATKVRPTTGLLWPRAK